MRRMILQMRWAGEGVEEVQHGLVAYHARPPRVVAWGLYKGAIMVAIDRKSEWIRRGFFAAGAINILGILLFSKGFTNPVLAAWEPRVFSAFGQGAVILWGLAYISVAGSYRHVKWLVAVFCVEKLVYGATWIAWMLRHGTQLDDVFEMSRLAWTIFLIYGPNDLFFAGFFGWVFLESRRSR